MRLSELMGKRIVNIYDGDILGNLGDSDLLVDPESGDIRAIILPQRRSSAARGRFRENGMIHIPWSAVCKVGSEVIVVDLPDGGIR